MRRRLLATAATFVFAVSIHPAFAQTSPGPSMDRGMGSPGMSGPIQDRERDQGIRSGQTEKGTGSTLRERAQDSQGPGPTSQGQGVRQDSQGLSEGGGRGETKAQRPSSRERATGIERERDTRRATERDRDQDRTRARSTERERDRSTRSTEREHDRSTRSTERNRDFDRRATQGERDQSRSTVQGERDRSRSTAQERSSRTRTTVDLNETQRTRISSVIRNARVEPLRNVNFSVRVGAMVPASVHFYPLPAEIVEIVPQYRGYYYVLVEDEIVIVEPRTRKIVTVIGYQQASRTYGARTRLSSDERQTIHSRTVTRTAPVRVSRTYEVNEIVPEDVDIYEFSEEVYDDVPEIRGYRYFPDERGDVVVVDPRERRVIEVID